MLTTLTPEQQAAIQCTAPSVTVSAAAGSGKTHVLTLRIIDRLCRKDDPFEIGRLMVVTFTKAAAAEMRTRIADAIMKRIGESPDDAPYLRRQLGLLSTAHIQTIHSFCSDLIKKHFDLCDLPPDFSVCDEPDAEALKQHALKRALDIFYEQPPEGFALLRAAVCEERGDSELERLVLSLYPRIMSHPDPEAWLLSQEADAGKPAADTLWFRVLFTEAEGHFAALAKLFEKLEKLCSGDPQLAEYNAEYIAFFRDRIACLSPLFASRDWDGIYASVRAAVPKKSAKRKYPSYEDFRPLAFQLESAYAAIASVIFAPLSEKCVPDAEGAPAVSALCRLMLCFHELYTAEKRAKRVIDYNDLEHFALKILRDERISAELREHFQEILVDEYQDTNEVQDEIFRLITPAHGSIFRVGDVKQSIYYFRLANPEIFLKHYNASDGASGVSIDMNTNFRSRPEVLSLCNSVFEKIMSARFGGIDYTGGQRLKVSDTAFEGQRPSELCILTPSDDGENDASNAETQALYVARRIKDMLGSTAFRPKNESVRTARPEDFAILLSSFKNNVDAYKKALEKYGIPCSAEAEKDIVSPVEATVVTSLLRILDNPRQDIPLISVLRSPFFSFTADDLAMTRLFDREGDLWDAVLAAARNGHAPCRRFLERYEAFARAARDKTVSRLLRYLYTETGAYGIFSALVGGDARVQTLDVLYQTALSFENGSFRSCGEFVSYLDRLSALGKNPAAPSGGGVKILSIHKSKGLEYPFVFVCNLEKKFNMADSYEKAVCHRDLGIALPYVDLERRVRLPSGKKLAVARKIKAELLSEEVRKLYVAFTRPREKLFLVMSLKEDKISDIYHETHGEPTESWLMSRGNAASWIIAALLHHPDAACLRAHTSDKTAYEPTHCLVCTEIPDGNVFDESVSLSPADESAADAADYTEYLKLSTLRYPYAKVSDIPSKLTPTGLSDALPDLQITERSQGDALRRGTAAHLFLSHADLSKCKTPEGAAAEKARLAELFPDMEAADESRIRAFALSEIWSRAAASDELLREYQFGVLLSPDEISRCGSDAFPQGRSLCDEKILVNGSIDLLFFEKGQAVIVDFKTDSVKEGSEAAAAERHRPQLTLYEKAVNAVFEAPVSEKIVYFLKTGKAVRL